MMGNGKNHNSVLFNCVHESIWESSEQFAADLVAEEDT